MSCDTEPPTDQSIDVYSCETWGVNYSVIIWSGVVLLAFLLLVVFALFARGNNVMGVVVTKVKIIYSDNLTFQIKNTSKLANMSKMIESLKSFSHMVCYVVTLVIMLAVNVYPVIRHFDEFSTHSYQYIFEVSAVFKRGVPLAAILLIAFVGLITFLNRAFLNTLTITRIEPKSHKNTPTSNICYHFQLFAVSSTKYLFILAFVSVVLGIDTLYVFGLPIFDSYEKSAVQFAIVVFSTLYRTVALPKFVSRFYRDDPRRSLIAYATISAFLDILAPCLATILIDDNCMRQYLYPASITTNYGFDDCIIVFLTNGVIRSCAQYRTTTSSYVFIPPFVYSNQCRNALISNFMWLIMSNSIVDTFLLPLVYLICNWNGSSLASHCVESDSSRNKSDWFITRLHHKIILFVFYNPRWVLSDVSHSLVAIFKDFAKLTIYGLISPFCAVAIGTGLISKIIILRVGIVRAYRLQKATVHGSDVDDSTLNIDSRCGVALEHSEILFWPSFVAATLFFAFFLWDMTSDSDEPVGAIPWVFLAVTLSAVLVIRITSYYFQQEPSTSIVIHDHARHWPGGVIPGETPRSSDLEMTKGVAEDTPKTEGTDREEEKKQESEGFPTVNPLQR
jgi:hypothetical protein